MDSSIVFKKKINLDHDQNFFSFEFTALDYLQPERNQYAYMLEGLDKDWIYNGNRQYASYSKVEPGKYIFRVKGSNSDGYWNEEGASIRIVILPPWWETTWAKIFYVLIFGFVVAGIWRFQTNRIQMKHQLELEKLQAEKLQEIDRMKSHFFANISHEFRTPLTLILGPLENLKTRISDSRSHQELNMIQRSAQRLYTLIGQLLDLSKLESGHMKLQAEQIDFIGFLKPIILSFATWAEKKNITLQFKHPEQPLNLYVDTEIMEKVVNNLLSNAMKFTPEGGRVTITTGFSSERAESDESDSADYVSLSVSDTGPGIRSDKIEHIFDRFYQAGNGTLNAQEGTGIGLALTHELVERHYGKIDVSSSHKEGTIFSVLLPLGPDCFRDGEIIRTGEKTIEPHPEAKEKQTAATEDFSIDRTEQPGLSSVEDAAPTGPSKRNSGNNSHYPLVLVVEDNPDLTLYMSNYLEEHYRVITSADGISGYQDTIRFMPDLIISDIMMPGMDGFELCSKLKSESRTSHIPVILLTARADGESKLKGLGTGADDYITKPFDIRELLLRVRNIIEQRHRLKERFSRDLSIKPSDVTVTSMDEQFLKKAIKITEDHMSDSSFNTSRFSREIGMSRQHLNEKLQALTGHSTREFMRIIRLKRAAQLLTQKSGNVTDVAYETGFNNLSHFAKIFREQFGVSPSDYASACGKQKHP